MRKLIALFTAAVLGACAHADAARQVFPRSSPLARGELTFRLDSNGAQHPVYRAHAGQTCPAAEPGDLRQRLVDLAVQEWARFNYPRSRRADEDELRRIFPDLPRAYAEDPYTERDPIMLQAIGGYWAVLRGVGSGRIADTGRHEINTANALWRRAAREYRASPGWSTPWSAAFVSWVMCEAGVDGFARSWAHRDYVDAAIAASDDRVRHPYRAYEADRIPLIGDLLCSSRDEYGPKQLADRRDNPDDEAMMHCDLVVAIDAPSGLILAIGGNVDNAVSLIPYRIVATEEGARVRSVCRDEPVCSDERLFAVLALDAPASEASLAEAPNLFARPLQPPPRMR